MQEYLEFATRIAYQAGEIMLNYFKLGVESQEKSDLSIVTKADQEITDFWTNRWLNSRLDYKPALTAVASSSPLK